MNTHLKKTITIIALILNFSLITNAQINYLEDSTYWNEFGQIVLNNTPPAVDYYRNYFILGDTLFNGYAYKKLYMKWVVGGIYQSVWPYTTGFLRQDGKKIYMNYYPNTDTLLYDYDLQLGQKLPKSFIVTNQTSYVSNIDSILVNGNYRRIFTLDSTVMGYDWIIEGAGHKWGLFTPIDHGWFDYTCAFSCFGKSNQVYVDSTFGQFCILNLGVDEHTVSGLFSIAFTNNSALQILALPFEHFTNGILTLYDINGAQIFNTQIISNQFQYHLHKPMQEGVYFARLNLDGKIFSKKIILN